MGPLLWLPMRGRGSEARISSGPPPIPTPPVPGYVLYLNSDSLSAGAVALWPDLSSSHNDVVQATMSKQPVAASGGLDGHISVTNDGIDDLLQSAAFTLNQPITRFTVVKVFAQAGVNQVFADGLAAFCATYLFQGTHDVKLFAGADIPGVTIDISKYHIITSVFNGASSKIFIEGVLGVTGNFGTNNAGGVTIGAAFNGTLPAGIESYNHLEYGSLLSDADRQSIQLWLATAPMYPSIVLGQPQITRADFSGLTGLDFVTGGVGKYFAITTSNSEIFVVWFNTGTETPPSYPGGTLAFMATITALSTASDIAAASITANAGSSGNVNTRFVCSQSSNAGIFQDLANAAVPTPPDAGTSGAAVSVVQTGSGNS